MLLLSVKNLGKRNLKNWDFSDAHGQSIFDLFHQVNLLAKQIYIVQIVLSIKTSKAHATSTVGSQQISKRRVARNPWRVSCGGLFLFQLRHGSFSCWNGNFTHGMACLACVSVGTITDNGLWSASWDFRIFHSSKIRLSCSCCIIVNSMAEAMLKLSKRPKQTKSSNKC